MVAVDEDWSGLGIVVAVGSYRGTPMPPDAEPERREAHEAER